MLIFDSVVFILLVLMAAIQPEQAIINDFELTRRSKAGDMVAKAAVRRENLLVALLSLQRMVIALLLVFLVLLVIVTFGWFLGSIVAAVCALEYGVLARLSPVHRFSQRLYEQYEPLLLRFVEKFHTVFHFLRNIVPRRPTTSRLESREELHHLVSQSGSLLSSDEKKLIIHGLSFSARVVHEVMTPTGVIDSINKKELLGPLVLDDLHKTGHSRFPVTDGDIDHVVGMLYIQSLFTLDTKRSVTAEKAMEPRVFYIHEDQTLAHALAAFLRTHHHLFIVVNEFRETVGIISLEDVVEALLGRKIIDEFDTHEDLRTVAMRNPRENNYPRHREDV